MKYETKPLSIEKIVGMKNANMEINPEYQRGLTWSRTQQMMFIDSIFRGYPIPVIFLHEDTVSNWDPIANKETPITKYQIIDGQQRINALYEYFRGEYATANKDEMRFPHFSKQTASLWDGKTFEDLNQELRKKFLETEISIIIIQKSKESANEARDLFIRLQAGSALNDQEKRDAWPGAFTAFMFKVGGKHGLAGNPGHDFFEKVMQIKSSGKDRGKVRKIAAQMYLLYSSFSERKQFESIKKENLDNLYRTHVAFDKDDDIAKKFMDILDELTKIFAGGEFPKMLNHEVFHLAVFVSSLLNDGAVKAKWVEGMPGAYGKFRGNFVKARAIKDDVERSKNEYWIHYGQHTKVSADAPDTIARRHEFFSAKMSGYLREKGFLIYKDQQRVFSSVEREVIFFRDDRKCLMCDAGVVWQDAEIHHVLPHAAGGETVLENGALVHRDCHPKIERDVQKAVELFTQKRAMTKQSRGKIARTHNRIPLPSNTQARAFYNGKHYQAVVSGKKWELTDGDGNVYETSTTPSGAAKAATGKNLSGYVFWEVKRPQDNNWMLLDDLTNATE